MIFQYRVHNSHGDESTPRFEQSVGEHIVNVLKALLVLAAPSGFRIVNCGRVGPFRTLAFLFVFNACLPLLNNFTMLLRSDILLII